MVGLRRKNVTKQQRRQVSALLEGGEKPEAVATKAAVSVSTVYKIKRENEAAERAKEKDLHRDTQLVKRHWDDLMQPLFDLLNSEVYPLYEMDLGRMILRSDEPCWLMAGG